MINEDELRRLAEASAATAPKYNPKAWYVEEQLADLTLGFEADAPFIAAARPTAVLALLDTIAALRQELRTVIDADNALVQRQRQELDAANQRAKAAQNALDTIHARLADYQGAMIDLLRGDELIIYPLAPTDAAR